MLVFKAVAEDYNFSGAPEAFYKGSARRLGFYLGARHPRRLVVLSTGERSLLLLSTEEEANSLE